MDVEEFLEHHGVKGQRWGIRNIRDANNARRQAHLDRLSRIASGNATTRDRRVVRRKFGSISTTKHGAKRKLHVLERRKKNRAAVVGFSKAHPFIIAAGAAGISAILARNGTVSVAQANKFANDKSIQLIRQFGSQLIKEGIVDSSGSLI